MATSQAMEWDTQKPKRRIVTTNVEPKLDEAIDMFRELAMFEITNNVKYIVYNGKEYRSCPFDDLDNLLDCYNQDKDKFFNVVGESYSVYAEVLPIYDDFKAAVGYSNMIGEKNGVTISIKGNTIYYSKMEPETQEHKDKEHKDTPKNYVIAMLLVIGMLLYVVITLPVVLIVSGIPKMLFGKKKWANDWHKAVGDFLYVKPVEMIQDKF